MNGSSKVNKAYQHQQRTKTQDSEYVRYRADCGIPFLCPIRYYFDQCVIDCYGDSELTVSNINDDPKELITFSQEVLKRMKMHDFDIVASASNLSWLHFQQLEKDVTNPTNAGYSFCNYVAKRLVLLRKAGKLVRKKMHNAKVRENKPKKRVANGVGGSLVRKVE